MWRLNQQPFCHKSRFLTTSPHRPTRDHQHHRAIATSMNDSNQTIHFLLLVNMYGDTHWSVNRILWPKPETDLMKDSRLVRCFVTQTGRCREDCHLCHSHCHFLSDPFTNNSSKWPVADTTASHLCFIVTPCWQHNYGTYHSQLQKGQLG